MIRTRLVSTAVPETIARSLADRDAALWIGSGFDASEEGLETLRALIGLPWRLVLCESTSAKLTQALTNDSGIATEYHRYRGGMYLIASNPRDLNLPTRCLPIYLLNGREDATETSDSMHLTRRATEARRFNMTDEVRRSLPARLVIIRGADDRPLDELQDLWREGLRTQISVVDSEGIESKRLDNWVRNADGPHVIDHLILPFDTFVSTLRVQLSSLIHPDRLKIRLGEGKGSLDVDITDCELLEKPLLDRYEIIASQELLRRSPEELSEDDFLGFFDRTRFDWKPFAAGLPWDRDSTATAKVLSRLREVDRDPPSTPEVLYIASESGAGGTTLARVIAFAMARHGFPALIARPNLSHADPLEVRKYLDRVRERIAEELAERSDPSLAGDLVNRPWLIVFDVEHWRGHEPDLRTFILEMAKSTRPVVLLLVRPPQSAESLQRAVSAKNIAILSHELTQEEVKLLGDHINQFLRPLGREKSMDEWRRFWEFHRPAISSSLASFWIALEFWLKRQLNIGESVQDWLYRQFRDSEFEDEIRITILEIAAMSAERTPMPEGLFLTPAPGNLPWLTHLESIREKMPALALVRSPEASNRQWALLHDLLGRYLLRSVFFDRLMLSKLGFDNARDPNHFRLCLLSRIAERRSLANPRYKDLSLEFACNILKLDPDANVEFLPFWRDVLDILDNMPEILWDTSRTFNHHTSISRRRVATVPIAPFDATQEEKLLLLKQAIDDLEYALSEIPQTDYDDSDLNLLNSLALAYQDLANAELASGCSHERFLELRTKATEAARRGQRLNPTTGYVLETLARDLIQNGRFNPENAASNAGEALGYIFQAINLDTSDLRRGQLNRLAGEALALLRVPEATPVIERLCKQNNPMGYLARAFLLLTEDDVDTTFGCIEEVSQDRVAQALKALEPIRNQSNPLVLRFEYDLVCRSEPSDFSQQLDLLELLDGSDPHLPAQLILERAILLHQRNFHDHAKREFSRLRALLRRSDQLIQVPDRLYWLLMPGSQQVRIVDAEIQPSDPNGRAWARVKEFGNLSIPFIPQEFDESRLVIGKRFKCSIAFGFKGPQAKPPRVARSVS